MRIDRLSLKNFKGFPEREFAFHPQMNLVVGVNGTGKTTLLDGLAVALGGWLLGIRGTDTRNIRPDELRLRAMTGKNTDHSKRVTWETQYPCEVEASGELSGEFLTWRRALNSPHGRTRSGEAKNIKALGTDADNAVRKGSEVILPLISYYGTGRLWDVPRDQTRVKSEKSLTRKSEHSRLAGYNHSLDPRISVSTLVKWIANQSWITFQQNQEPLPYATVRTAISKCLDRASGLHYDARRGEVVITIADQGPQPFSNLSDGQRTMLALVADIAQKAATLNPDLGDRVLNETPGVVLIDELDLHLHPIWQRRVIEDLRQTFPKIQFVATTHSPFLIQSLRSGEELLMLEGSPTAQLANRTLDEIAVGIMGVPESDTSLRYEAMKKTATNYLETLEKAALAPETKRTAYEERLAESIAPYADNPAYQAFLEMRRAAKLGK